jgi:hypothetical protein
VGFPKSDSMRRHHCRRKVGEHIRAGCRQLESSMCHRFKNSFAIKSNGAILSGVEILHGAQRRPRFKAANGALLLCGLKLDVVSITDFIPVD